MLDSSIEASALPDLQPAVARLPIASLPLAPAFEDAGLLPARKALADFCSREPAPIAFSTGPFDL